MAKYGFKGSMNVQRVVMRIVGTIIALYAGGITLTQVGSTMNGTCSPFYQGLTLIGWTVGSATCSTTSATDANTITATSGTGVLSVVGILAIASIVLEFINIKL